MDCVRFLLLRCWRTVCLQLMLRMRCLISDTSRGILATGNELQLDLTFPYISEFCLSVLDVTLCYLLCYTRFWLHLNFTTHRLSHLNAPER